MGVGSCHFTQKKFALFYFFQKYIPLYVDNTRERGKEEKETATTINI